MFRAEGRAERKAGKDKRCRHFRSRPKQSSTFTKTSFQNQSNCVGDSQVIDHFADTVAILISIVSISYYGIPRGHIHINLPPERPTLPFETIEIKMAAVSAKRSMRQESSHSRHLGPCFKISMSLYLFLHESDLTVSPTLTSFVFCFGNMTLPPRPYSNSPWLLVSRFHFSLLTSKLVQKRCYLI